MKKKNPETNSETLPSIEAIIEEQDKLHREIDKAFDSIKKIDKDFGDDNWDYPPERLLRPDILSAIMDAFDDE